VILCYHGVASGPRAHDPRFQRVPPTRFAAQMDRLAEAGFEFVTVAELARRARGGEPPPGLAAISFDDGLDDNHSTAMPILLERGIAATFYITTGFIGKPHPWLPPAAGARMMTAAELRDLAEAGFEIGGHTVTHPDMSRMDRAACLREMTDSRHVLRKLTGAPVETFAYPRCRYGPAATEAAREAGFIAAVTCQGHGSWAPYEMKRAMISGKDGMPSFVAKLADAYQPVFDSVPGRVLRATTRGARRRARALVERDGAR
jgi:peptidoglycan/xylan/chitin deacetylase (PgdA/CDA1 family)